MSCMLSKAEEVMTQINAILTHIESGSYATLPKTHLIMVLQDAEAVISDLVDDIKYKGD